MTLMPLSGLVSPFPEAFPFSSFMPETLHGLLNERAKNLGDRQAYTFEGTKGDQIVSFAQLNQRARAIAATLQQRHNVGDRVLLMFPAGLDFIASFFGCLYAGVLAVPTTYPKPRRPNPRLTSIANDSGAVAALTDHDTLTTIDQSIRASGLPEMEWLAVDTVADSVADEFKPHDVQPHDLAFLQYTSGSTSDPKGVMVSHRNLLHNLEMIRQGFGLKDYSAGDDYDTGVFWLPAYHDMGLIGGILESLYVGGHSVLMSPAAFLQRPVGWLEAMSKHKATITGAPNFAYELCVERSNPEQREQLDLSNWKVAFCGAEPIRPDTIARFVKLFGPCGFSENAFYPCYGLAEGTLLAAGGDGPGPLHTITVDRHEIEQHKVRLVEDAAEDGAHQCFVTCGSAKMDQELAIVNPESFERCAADEVGEVWLAGESVAQGYWNRAEETEATFGAKLRSGEGPFMRTGDLGFIANGELVITGRVKDVIIIRGRNHYPQDIEKTVGEAHAALRPDSGAVFTIERDGQEQVVATHEIDRQYRKADFDEITRCVRRAVSAVHELELFAVVLIRHANLPRTTSGKPQRNLCRQQYEAGELKVLHEWCRESRGEEEAETASANGTPERLRRNGSMSPDEIDRLGERIESWLLNWLVERAAIPAQEVDRNKPFAEYGLDSMTAVELSQELEDWVGVEVVPTVAWNYPTPATLSVYLARQAGGATEIGDEPADESTGR